MKATISTAGVNQRDIEIMAITALEHIYHMVFSSRPSTSSNPLNSKNNFYSLLSRDKYITFLKIDLLNLTVDNIL